jgi:di/tricarboxylate transporter
VEDSTISLLVLLAVIVVFVWNRLPVALVAVLTSLTLYVTGVLDADQALAGFGDSVIVFIAALFVVSEGLDASGVTTWAGQRLLAVVGDSSTRALVSVMALAALLSALISLNGAAAALIPVVVVVALRLGLAPGRLLLPMAFGGSAGSLLILTASPVNVLVTDAAEEAGSEPFGFFSFSLVGVPILAATVLVAVLLARRVLPARQPAEAAADLSRYAATMAEHYDLTDGFYRLRVPATSGLVGCAGRDLDLSAHPGLVLIAVQHDGVAAPPGDLAIEPADVLVVSGPADEVSSLAVEHGLAVAMRPLTRTTGDLVTREMGVVELVIPPRSAYVGDLAFPGLALRSDLVVLGVRRLGEERGARTTRLQEGDALLVHGSWEAIDELATQRDVLVVDDPDRVRRQTVPLGAASGRALVVLAAMIVLLALGLVPPAIAALSAAAAMVLLRVVSPTRVYRAISWETLILVGGLIPLSTAIQTSGAADIIADRLLGIVGDGEPILVMVALFLLTAVMGQFVSNTATVLIVIPIALAAATESGVSPLPLLMAVAVAGAASFLTPVATPANMMVMGPSGMRFGDYWRLGLPLLLVWLVLAVLIIPRVWPL